MEHNNFELLSTIKSPKDLKKLSMDELTALCEEIRQKLILTVSENGGHLAPNLGVVELTVAMHYVFDCPDDSIVWDVGHQSYTHKMLTGRYDRIDTIRKAGGLSGFPRRYESEYDDFGAGHSSTSVSAALGIAKAKQLKGEKSSTIAFIGDGSFTGGLAFEGINNAGRFKGNFIVILNDNKMSISQNVGAVSKHFNAMRISPWYVNAKSGLERILNKIPLIGKPSVNGLTRLKNWFKRGILKTNLFEIFGFRYYGPVDGHSLEDLIKVMQIAKASDKPLLIHALTVKGKGYQFAENDPKSFHGIGRFDIDTGEPLSHSDSYSNTFGKTLCTLALKDKSICGITAAMTVGTGLTEFSEKYKDRFFDVGIAEEHAVTFGSGLASKGMKPVFAVYSSFLQRAYDQLVHDAAAQNLHLTLAIDRAGIVGEDGETHQGVFDVSILNSIPGTTIYSPCYFEELELSVEHAISKDTGLTAVRYPRGCEPSKPENFVCRDIDFTVYGNPNASRLIVTYGRLFSEACKAKEQLSAVGIETCILKLCRIKPINPEAVGFAVNFKRIYFFEEGMRSGGVGESFEYELYKRKFSGTYNLTAIDDTFILHSKDTQALHALKLDAEGMYSIIRK